MGSEDFDGSRDRWEPSALTAVISDGSSRDGQEARLGHVAPCQSGISHVGGGVHYCHAGPVFELHPLTAEIAGVRYNETDRAPLMTP